MTAPQTTRQHRSACRHLLDCTLSLCRDKSWTKRHIAVDTQLQRIAMLLHDVDLRHARRNHP